MTTLREAAQQALEALIARAERGDGAPDTVAALRAALEQPEQEPVAWIESPHGAIRANPLYRMTAPQSLAWSIPLYTHPPRREWQSLTDEEIDTALPHEPGDLDFVCARAIEAALKEKNT